MHQIIKLILAMSLCTLFSCSYLQKIQDRFQNRPQMEGGQDITDVNMNSDQRGSDTGQIEGLSTVYFELDSAKLTTSIKDTLNSNKAWLDNNSNVKTFLLEGHCDPLGSEAYNIGLGEKRAQSVWSYLKSIGLSEDKMNIISYGEEQLFSNDDNALNRRVNFVPQY